MRRANHETTPKHHAKLVYLTSAVSSSSDPTATDAETDSSASPARLKNASASVASETSIAGASDGESPAASKTSGAGVGACVGVIVGVVVGVCVGGNGDAPADADAEKAETGVSAEDVAASAARDGNAPADADADTIETASRARSRTSNPASRRRLVALPWRRLARVRFPAASPASSPARDGHFFGVFASSLPREARAPYQTRDDRLEFSNLLGESNRLQPVRRHRRLGERAFGAKRRGAPPRGV